MNSPVPWASYKRCSCGRDFTREQWGKLLYVGPWDDGVDVMELRNCDHCHSTIAVVIGPSSKVCGP